MTVPTTPKHEDSRIILENVRWSAYEALFDDLGPHRGRRIFYDGGSLEIDLSSSSLERAGIHTALGVREIWRHDGESVGLRARRADGKYTNVEQSIALPCLFPANINRLLSLANSLNETEVFHRFQVWVREFPVDDLGTESS